MRWGKHDKPDFLLWEQMCRSMLGSFLRTTGLQHLNRLSGWTGVVEFTEDDVPMLEAALVEVAFYSKPGYAEMWFEDEGVVVPGLQSRTQMLHHHAGKQMPLSLLREVASKIARTLILPSMEPYRVQTWQHRKAWIEWMRDPRLGHTKRFVGVIPDRDLAFFEEHGLYPAHWRGLEQAFRDRCQVLGKISGQVRQPDRAMLLALPEDLSVEGQQAALAEVGVKVTTRTIARWRKALIDSGVVTAGQEPWHIVVSAKKATAGTAQ